MRKVKLQMQMSLDGFVAGPNGDLDWMTWTWDEELKKHLWELTGTIDTILMGRKMSPDFLKHWENIADNKPDDDEFEFAKVMVKTPKIIFSKTVATTAGRNARMNNGNLAEEIKKLRQQDGKDIIVYGGAGFVASMLKEDLLDELHLFIHPTAIGKGMSIFNTLEKTRGFKLVRSKGYACGVVCVEYTRA